MQDPVLILKLTCKGDLVETRSHSRNVQISESTFADFADSDSISLKVILRTIFC